MSKTAIKIKNLSKSYINKKEKIDILKNINVEFEYGKMYAIIGHSGSGKTTFLNILGLMLNMNSGEYILNNQNISALKENEKCKIRLNTFGYIFQDYNLTKTLKAIENVELPMVINANLKKENIYNKSIKLLEMVNLNDRKNHYPKELSGGEQQRVAIARALANDPDIILADEPTGNLDKKNEKEIFNILKKLACNGKCIIVISHSKEIMDYADIIYELDNGYINKVEHE